MENDMKYTTGPSAAKATKLGGGPKFVSKTPRALTLICRRVPHFDNNPALRALKYRHSGMGDAGAI